jgi:hypothetical protein
MRRDFSAYVLAVMLSCVSAYSFALTEETAVIKTEVRILPNESKSFDFGTVPQKDTTVLLDVFSRLDSKGFGGSMYFMKIVLNGHPVKAAKTRTVSRLQNRPVVSPVAANLPYSWFGGHDAWRVLYAPDFEGALKHTFYVGNPYQLIFDVTDLTNPAAENRLEITNLFNYPPKSVGTKGELVIKGLTIHTKPGPSPTMTADATDRDVINRGTPGAGPAAYAGQLLPGGGFAITVNGLRFEFSSAISYPNAGLNKLTVAERPDTTGQNGWTVRAESGPEGGVVAAEGPDYSVRRIVRFTPRKVEVADEVTNLHRDQKLGLLFKDQVSLKNKNAAVRLAGNPDPAINEYYSNGNPTVYLALENLGIGLLIEDDVFRNQATLFYDTGSLEGAESIQNPSAGFRTEMLCLQPGGSYTLRWSVYPVASNDYYDFINLVRQDWSANYTVEGAWTFFSPDTIIATPMEKIRERFRRLGITRACYCGGWVDWKHDKKKIGFGTGVMDPYWADFRRRLREAAVKIRQAVPDCKVLVYYDTQRDTSDGGHVRFSDSWLTDPKGNQFSTEWSGVYSLTYSVVATLQDTFGKAMLQVADRYMDEIKADGLYWDEMEGVAYGTPLITHNIPDGYSCLLNKDTYTIDHEVGVTTLLGEGHRLAVIDRIRAQGGTLMGNGPCATRKILAKKPQRMIEIQHNDSWCYEGNLESPLGYASSRMDFGNWIRALRMGMLLVGTRYDYEHEISRYVFPFTPIELHSGYLLGQERIITIHSGNYGWPRSKLVAPSMGDVQKPDLERGWPGQHCLVQVRHFDKDGKLTGKDFPTIIGTETRTKVDLSEGEAAVLERLPIFVQPNSGTAEVSSVRYDAKGMSFTMKCLADTKIRVASGPLKIAPGQRCTINIGETAHKVPAGADGVLTYDVTFPTPTNISIQAE